MVRTIPHHRFNELVEAATQVFITQGYRRTQMADVAKAMGLAKGTLYGYVESKAALFDAALRYGDHPGPIAPPARFPIPTPEEGATLQFVEKRVQQEAQLENLDRALREHRAASPRQELESIVRELYGRLSRNRVGIKLVDRCAADHPALAAVWFRVGRLGLLEPLTRYLEMRARGGQLRPLPDLALAARVLLETIVLWAVHRHWDPAPQALDEAAVEETLVRFLVDPLFEE
jgi:AcrR family transcriptional regulator